MSNSDEKSKKSKINMVKIIITLIVFIMLFLIVFFLYDSPAKVVPTQDGKAYLNSEEMPSLYYTDLFGNTFYVEDGKRVYAAVPTYIEQNTNS